MKLQFQNYFSVPVLFGTIDKDIIDSSLAIAENYMKLHHWAEKTKNGKTITTFHDDKNINYLGLVDDIQLLKAINNSSRSFLEIIGINPEIDLRVESWLNLNTPLSSHSHHEHYGSIAGGVVYLKANENSGNLTFHDPIKSRVQANVYNKQNKRVDNEYNFQTISVKPEVGKIVMFESWLTHAVEPNQSNEDRISIAFNIYEHK